MTDALLMFIIVGMILIALGVDVAVLVGWLRGKLERRVSR
jgi:hypothetical protein